MNRLFTFLFLSLLFNIVQAQLRSPEYQKGKAMWRYVTSGYENSTEVSVEEGISPGDTVIYDNNLGLSHMNTVVIEN